MPTIKLPFRKFPLYDQTKKISGYQVLPLIPVTINPTNIPKLYIRFYALIDTGASKTLFPGYVAKKFGFDLKNIPKDKKIVMSGIKASITCCPYKIDLTIEHPEDTSFIRQSFTGIAYFSEEYEGLFGLLGQDFLSGMKMNLSVDYKHFSIELNY